VSNAQFKRDFAAILARAKDKADLVVRRSALEIMNGLVQKSPVDTGRFQGNWQVGIGGVNALTSSDADKAGASAIGRTNVAVQTFKPGQTIYLTNSLPYAQRLEYGYSQQAPGGMVRLTVVEYQQIIRKAASAL
jgi:hypothetical protein